MSDQPTASLKTDASELIAAGSGEYAIESYVFEPSSAEAALGKLVAVGALHQANLVLHDAAEQGIRDWIGYFHVAVGVIAQEAMHVSTAGHAAIFLARKSNVSLLSADLSYSPITEPLRTFAQVASGTIEPHDTVFFGTPALQTAFRTDDLARFSIDNGADRISTRLELLYGDQQLTAPLATVVLTCEATNSVGAAKPALDTVEAPRSQRQAVTATVAPRQPIVIERSIIRATFTIVWRGAQSSLSWLRQVAWPIFLRGTRLGGRAVARASVTTGSAVSEITKQSVQRAQSGSSPVSSTAVRATAVQASAGLARTVVAIPYAISDWIKRLPRTSKIFAALTLVLTVVLVTTLLLLQNKRTEDVVIQQASETLHDARTKVDAAETALIYDNRDQARNLLTAAEQQTADLSQNDIYTEEVASLAAQIQTIQDRLQRVTRITADNLTTVGSFADVLGNTTPSTLHKIGDTLYTFNPTTNAIIALSEDGSTTSETDTTSGIGFLSGGIAHTADKSIIYTTDAPGIALFDAKTGELQPQEILFSSEEPELGHIAAYGSRLYAYDGSKDNIYSFTKSLRGYGSGVPWVTDDSFPTATITSLAVDGSIYTLHQDGSLRQLFKGETADFTAEPVDPPLSNATRIVTDDTMTNLYVIDVPQRRVVVYDKDGTLLNQYVIDTATDLRDVIVSADETQLYILDGQIVSNFPLSTSL